MVVTELEDAPVITYDTRPLPKRVGKRDIVPRYRGDEKGVLSRMLNGFDVRLLQSSEHTLYYYWANCTKLSIPRVIIVHCIRRIQNHEPTILLQSGVNSRQFMTEDLIKTIIAPQLSYATAVYLPQTDTEFVVSVVDIERYNIDFEVFKKALEGYSEWPTLIDQLPRVAFSVKWVFQKKQFLIASDTIAFYPGIS